MRGGQKINTKTFFFNSLQKYQNRKTKSILEKKLFFCACDSLKKFTALTGMKIWMRIVQDNPNALEAQI